MLNGQHLNLFASELISIEGEFEIQPDAVFSAVLVSCPSGKWDEFGKVTEEDTIDQVVPEEIPYDLHLDDGRIELFPNPVKEYFNIRITGQVPPDASVEIKDVFGATIFQTPLQGSVQLSVDMSELTPGVYFVSVEWPDFYQVFKLVKVH